jgi:thioredoxin-related protein
MKKWIIVVALLVSGVVSKAQDGRVADAGAIQWMGFEEAVAASEKQPKKIFIDVYTEWCGWCKKMDKTTFVDPAVAKYMNENYYPVKFDAESSEPVHYKGVEFVKVMQAPGKGVHQLAAALLQNKLSYPSYVLLDEEQKLLQVIPGYQEAKMFLPILHFFGDDAYKTTPWADYYESFSQGDAKKE